MTIWKVEEPARTWTCCGCCPVDCHGGGVHDFPCFSCAQHLERDCE